MATPVSVILWLLAVSFALREAEEWNLASWEAAHFTPPPRVTDLAVRTLLVLFALLGLSFTALSLRLLSLRGAVIALLPFFLGVVLGNALTHIFWLFYFGGYAPGVGDVRAPPRSALRLARLPGTGGAPGSPRLRPGPPRHRHAPAARRCGGRASLSEAQLALQGLAVRLAEWLWGAA